MIRTMSPSSVSAFLMRLPGIREAISEAAKQALASPRPKLPCIRFISIFRLKCPPSLKFAAV